ncbi:hypothetical protein EYC55_15895 [Xanthomonas oryzae]|nr:hypothetical protein EYC55_15895 [Xanthomonas oryzae]
MPPHSEQIVSRICGALFRGSLAGWLAGFICFEASLVPDARDSHCWRNSGVLRTEGGDQWR